VVGQEPERREYLTRAGEGASQQQEPHVTSL